MKLCRNVLLTILSLLAFAERIQATEHSSDYSTYGLISDKKVDRHFASCGIAAWLMPWKSNVGNDRTTSSEESTSDSSHNRETRILPCMEALHGITKGQRISVATMVLTALFLLPTMAGLYLAGPTELASDPSVPQIVGVTLSAAIMLLLAVAWLFSVIRYFAFESQRSLIFISHGISYAQ